jgi:hypothetical protein
MKHSERFLSPQAEYSIKRSRSPQVQIGQHGTLFDLAAMLFKTVGWLTVNMADAATLDVAVEIIAIGRTGRVGKKDLNRTFAQKNSLQVQCIPKHPWRLRIDRSRG